MRKLFVILCLLCSLNAMADVKDIWNKTKAAFSKKDTISISYGDSVHMQMAQTIETNRMTIDGLTTTNNQLSESLNAARGRNAEVEAELAKLSQRVDSLAVLLQKQNNLIVLYEKKLINLVGEYLYQPYNEDYVTNLALPAFEAIPKEHRTEERELKYILLRDYKTHIQEVCKYLQELKGVNTQLEAFFKNKVETEFLPKFNELAAVKGYMMYDYWPETYLGVRLAKIKGLLEHPNSDTFKKNVSDILNELQPQLKAK